jgi:Mg2+/citrate symporter
MTQSSAVCTFTDSQRSLLSLSKRIGMDSVKLLLLLLAELDLFQFVTWAVATTEATVIVKARIVNTVDK